MIFVDGKDEEIVCSDCGWKIDPNVCYCGDPRVGHELSHTFVPMGCVCQSPKEVPHV